MYNSYEAKVSEDYKIIEYNNNVYIKSSSMPKDCKFYKKIKAFQKGESLCAQWLVSPMCNVYISNDKKEYIEIITEDDTVDKKVMYYKLDEA